MQPTQDALIESKVPPGYKRLAPGTIVKEGDLAWNFHSRTFQATNRFVAIRGVGPRKVTASNYIIRKVNQEVHPEQTVSQDQAQTVSRPMPKSYGDW